MRYNMENMQLSGVLIRHDVSFKELCTFRLGGVVRTVLYPKSIQAFVSLLQALEQKSQKYVVLGKGSNILPPDGVFDTPVICTKLMRKWHFEDNVLFCECGASLAEIAQKSVQQGLKGLEFGAQIPASMGAAIRLNAGAFGGQVGDCVKNVTVWHNNAVHIWSQKDCQFGYRTSKILHSNAIVLQAELVQGFGQRLQLERIVEQNKMQRAKTQPKMPCAGSVFKSVNGVPCGLILQKCGLKGRQIGGAMVSPIHANFIVNCGNAKQQDVLELIDLCKQHVLFSEGAEPQLEIDILSNGEEV